MDTIFIYPLESCQYLRISESVDISSVDRLVEKFLFSSTLLIRHTSFEDTVLVWKREYDIAWLIDEGLFRGIVESYLIRIVSDASLAERIIHNKKHLQM